MSMAIPYFLVTCLVGVLAIPVTQSKRIKSTGNSKLYILLINVILIVFSAFRQISAVSIDEYAYRNRFVNYSWLSLTELFEQTSEYIFAFVVWLSTRLFDTTQGVIILTGCITTVLYLRAIRKYSKDYAFAIVLLMVTGLIYNSFNGIQQYMAAAVFICFCDCLEDQKIGKFLMLIAACTLIHDSAIILVFVYLLGKTRLGSSKMWFYQIGFLIAGFIGYRFVPVLAAYSSLLSSFASTVSAGHHGVIWITVLINQVPMIVVLISSHGVRERYCQTDYMDNLFGNMAVLNGMVYLLATMDVYIARLGIYTEPFALIYLSNHISSLTKQKSVGKCAAVILYSIVLYLRMRNSYYTFNFAF